MAAFDATYERVKLLGEGAFGAAYLVRKKDGPKVFQVAKEIRISHLSEKQREAALAESEVHRKMSHSNIIAYITSFLEGSKLYIIMEYADGGDLACKIRDRREEDSLFEERNIMFIFVQVSLALLHIHSRQILHRDIKPLNIFLTQQGVVKLGDFGIAKVLDTMTAAAGTMIGTPAYLSPEVCNNEAYGKKSDLWSLGVVTYELTKLRVPFSGSSVPAIAMKICGAEPEPLPQDFSPDLKWIVSGLLEKEPDKRPRLDKILQIPFVQRYIQELLSHTVVQGSGGCEAMVEVKKEQKRIEEVAARKESGGRENSDPRRMLENAVEDRPSRHEEDRSSKHEIRQDRPARHEEDRSSKHEDHRWHQERDEHWGHAGSSKAAGKSQGRVEEARQAPPYETERDARHRQRQEDWERRTRGTIAGSPQEDVQVRGSHRGEVQNSARHHEEARQHGHHRGESHHGHPHQHEDARREEERKRYRGDVHHNPHREERGSGEVYANGSHCGELHNGARINQDGERQQIARAEYLRNRELAAQVKRRYESEEAAIGLTKEAEERWHVVSAHQPNVDQRYSDSQQDIGERRKAEVRRKAQEERAEQEALQKRRLEEAMREQEEDRRQLKANRQRRAEGQSTDRVEEAAEDRRQTSPLDDTVIEEAVPLDASKKSEKLDATIATETFCSTERMDSKKSENMGATIDVAIPEQMDAPNSPRSFRNTERMDSKKSEQMGATIDVTTIEQMDSTIISKPIRNTERMDTKTSEKMGGTIDISAIEQMDATIAAETFLDTERMDATVIHGSTSPAATSSPSAIQHDEAVVDYVGGLSIPFGDTRPKRAKPKLSSESRVARRARPDASRSELKELPPDDHSARGHAAAVGSRTRVASGGPPNPQRRTPGGGSASAPRHESEPPGQISQARKSRTSPGPSTRRHIDCNTTERESAPEESYQKSRSCSNIPGDPNRPPRLPRAATAAATGSPASWLRTAPLPGEGTLKNVLEDAVSDSTQCIDAGATVSINGDATQCINPDVPTQSIKVVPPSQALGSNTQFLDQLRDSTSAMCIEGGDVMTVTMDWAISTGSSTIKLAPLPTPQGGGDLSKMQDALQQALCGIDGRTLSKRTVTDIPEEINGGVNKNTTELNGTMLRQSQGAGPIAGVTGVSVRSDWASDKEDE